MLEQFFVRRMLSGLPVYIFAESVAVRRTTRYDTLDAVKSLHEQGYTVYAVEQAHDSTTLEDIKISNLQSPMSNCPKIAVIFGHEVFGVQQSVVDACDGCIEIPQYGTKHSLNVSVTAGIVLYELSNMLRNIISRT